MSISKWLDHSASSKAKKFDVVIVGAGIAGLSAAYWLQKKDPKLKIAVIEKHRVGFGASGRNAGFVTCGSTEHFMKLEKDFGLDKALEIWKFSEENHRLLKEEIIQDKGDEIEYRKTGSCTVAPNEERWLEYRAAADKMTKAGLRVSEVSPPDLKADYGIEGFVGGINYAGDGYVDPVKLLHLLRKRITKTSAKNREVEFFEGTEVFAIDEHKHHVDLRTDHGVFEAENILLTLNAYLPLVDQSFQGLITPGRGQILMTKPLPAFVKGPCYLTKHLAYFRQLPSGELLVGGFRNLAREAENTYADETTTVIQQALGQFLKDHFKYGAEAKVAYQWSGIMGFSPDGQMILGKSAQSPRVHVMAGCSGHGMGLSFHAGKTLVSTLHGGEVPAHLDVKRFSRSSTAV